MGGKIDCYVDPVSWFSYIAFVDLLANREKLAAHGVELEFHPVFLGGIMKASGNNPPWMLPSRGKYYNKDSPRVAARVGLPDIRFPPNFLAMSNSLIALRALHFIRANYPTETLLTALRFLFHSFFTPPHRDISKADSLAEILRSCPAGFDGPGRAEGGGAKLFTDAEVAAIMAGAATDAMRASVRDETNEAVAKGAYGAPWLCVKNGEGKEDVFFGSDRFVYVYRHLGLPIQELEILAPGESASKL
ncbi:related to glutathione S-transferase [Cephalotrichum gorgonifer]|uniref:Glutathione S-transferase kappa n=1 Tax=Cephalotrichum gorgonifer TaxID=2041049 RepID=A0AAE8SU32_9PEZI|nr:related to glutathione S-transferase [Cephalotrichum gorgonifer]